MQPQVAAEGPVVHQPVDLEDFGKVEGLKPPPPPAPAGDCDRSWRTGLFMHALKPIPRPEGTGEVWSIEGARTTATISDQFKANARDYHDRYSASSQFRGLFRSALRATGVELPEAPLILDMGSGSGVNSIVPFLTLCPGSRQVATDLSAELLGILADYLRGTEAENRVVCVVMDAMGYDIAPGRFDLVTGAAILHHLVSPARAVKAAFRALKPGGHAVFLEPFEGHALIRLAYERILAEAKLRGEALDPELDRALRWMTMDIALRTRPDPKNNPDFAKMDDKWLFSRVAVELWARQAGFADVAFVPHNDHPTLYRDVAQVNIRLATGANDLALPRWAVAILDEFDAAVPLQMKRLNMLEGSIVLTKGE